MKLQRIKDGLNRGYTRLAGQSILVCSSLLFADEARASLGNNGWGDSTNTTMKDVMGNVQDTLSSSELVLTTGAQVLGFSVFAGCVYKIIQMKTRNHDNTGTGKFIIGAIAGVIIFSAGTFMSITKNTLVN